MTHWCGSWKVAISDGEEIMDVILCECTQNVRRFNILLVGGHLNSPNSQFPLHKAYIMSPSYLYRSWIWVDEQNRNSKRVHLNLL